MAQGSEILGQTVEATDKMTFEWSNATEVRFVRGELALLSTLVFNDSGSLADAVSFVDTDEPRPGDGFYYLFAPDCDGRSYQTVLGAEPDRDLAAFP